jgi:hypothetical protein
MPYSQAITTNSYLSKRNANIYATKDMWQMFTAEEYTIAKEKTWENDK